jgi:predicted DNA-binding transcriptional regulator AlpA
MEGAKDCAAALIFRDFAMTDSEAIGSDKRRRADVLPSSLPPRGLSRVQAAAYIGVSPSTFDKMVADGTMPSPKKMRGRVVWDRKRVDWCFDAFDDSGENPWD